MKKKLLKCAMMSAGILFTGCDKSSVDSFDDDFYVPDFSNQWTVIKGPASDFIFINLDQNSVDSAKGTGAFTGEVDEPNGSVLKIAGSFVNVKVNMTITSDSLNTATNTPPLADSSYTGVYDALTKTHILRMVNVVSPHDSLVLQHG